MAGSSTPGRIHEVMTQNADIASLDSVLSIFDLPSTCRVSQRISKSALIENSDLTSPDRRILQNDVNSIFVVAVVDPYSTGVPAFLGETADGFSRDYAEIYFVNLAFGAGTDTSAIRRFIEVVHRSIPNPVVILASAGTTVYVSMASKHTSLADSSRVVLDRITTCTTETLQSFLGLLRMSRQGTSSLETLYRSWEQKILAAQLARLWKVGPDSLLHPPKADSLPAVLEQQLSLSAAIQTLQARLHNEKQMAERVSLNTQIQGLRSQMEQARNRYT